MRHSLRLIAAVLAAAAATACSHMPDLGNVLPGTGAASIEPGLSPRERVRSAIDLLGQGQAVRAEAELEAALEAEPGSTTARRLLAQLNEDPRSLLTGEAAPYTVRTGETMSQLAERFQGDALLFYALARYNDISAPNAVSAGQTLMIPRRPGMRVTTASTPSPLGAGASVAASSAAPAGRSGESARANQLRLQALQLLNGGQVDQAVDLLQRAQALDINNVAVQRDLARAQRLQASLRGRSGSN